MRTSHITSISKILTDLCFTKQRLLARVVYSVFCSKNVKEFCLSINVAQSVRLGKGSTEFKNYFKQIPVPFKIYADFECNLKSVESYEGSYSKKKKKQKKRFLLVFLTNLFGLMINLVSRLLFLGVEMMLIKLLKQFLKSMNTVKG